MKKCAIYGTHPSTNTTAFSGAEQILKEKEQEATGRKLRRTSIVIDLSQEQAGWEFPRLQTMETQVVRNASILHAEANPLVWPDNSPSTSRAAKMPDKSDVARKSKEDEASFRGQIPSRPSSIGEGCMGDRREDVDVSRVQIPSGKPSGAEQEENGSSDRVVARSRSHVSVSLSESSVSSSSISPIAPSGDAEEIRRE